MKKRKYLPHGTPLREGLYPLSPGVQDSSSLAMVGEREAGQATNEALSLLETFALLFEAHANTGTERMKIINEVAKSVPQPHKVDLNNPDKTILVQIAKTICMVGVAERYKELSIYNLSQLTAPQQ